MSKKKALIIRPTNPDGFANKQHVRIQGGTASFSITANREREKPNLEIVIATDAPMLLGGQPYNGVVLEGGSAQLLSIADAIRRGVRSHELAMARWDTFEHKEAQWNFQTTNALEAISIRTDE